MVMMLMVMVMTAAAMLVMVMVMFVVMHQLCDLSCQGSLTLHSLDQLCTGEGVPGSGDDGSSFIVLPEHSNCSIQLLLGNGIGAGENNGRGGFHLVVIELTKVLHINLDLAGVHNSNGVAQGHFLIGDLIDRCDHIRQLANTGGFNNDAIRIVLLNDLGQCLAEVTHQAAADAAGIHFGNVNTGILQEAAIDTDLTELVFNEHQLLTAIAFLDHLLDEGSLTCAQKTGVNINFCHKNTFCS